MIPCRTGRASYLGFLPRGVLSPLRAASVPPHVGCLWPKLEGTPTSRQARILQYQDEISVYYIKMEKAVK
jgi:hypothetical protein